MNDAWILSARNGYPRAFAELVEGYHRSIYGLAFSTVGDWQAAEDIAQDAFLVAWVKMGKLRSQDAIGAWLHRTAHNLAYNWTRSRRYQHDLRQRREVLALASNLKPSAVENLARGRTARRIRCAARYC